MARNRPSAAGMFLHFDRSGECAWVTSQGLNDPDDIGVEIAFPDQAQPLFASHVERIMIAKQLTASDSRSQGPFDLNIDIDAFTADMKAEFGVDVDPWAYPVPNPHGRSFSRNCFMRRSSSAACSRSNALSLSRHVDVRGFPPLSPFSTVTSSEHPA